MKKILSITVLSFFTVFAIGQAPQALNYQAVARTADGVIIPTQNISVRFSVLDVSVTGTVLYSETHQTTTNSYGLFTLAIGKGVPVTATFPGINWASGTDKFLKVEIAPVGGYNFQLQGTTQLLSVPYALYSEKTRLIAGNNTINITNGNTITGNYQAANNTILVAGNTIAGNYQPANNTVAITGNTIAGNYQPANNTIAITGNTIAGNYQPANNTIAITGNTIAGNYQPANNTVAITGNTIAGNYQPANNTILVNGNTIAGNYQAANSTVLVNGNTIAANYQAGTGINIAGNTISHNLLAGPGVSITGNTISATSSTLWIPDTYGIHNQSGNIGIRTNSVDKIALVVSQENTGGASGAMDVFSGDNWQTVIRFRNTTVNQEYQFNLHGSNNIDNTPGSLGIYHGNTTNWVWHTNPTNDYVGIGSYNYKAPLPKSRLHVFNGDVNIDQIGSGIIMKSPNGACWRITIDNTGTLVRTAITCPN